VIAREPSNDENENGLNAGKIEKNDVGVGEEDDQSGGGGDDGCW
jgi:hypothetical protein